MISIFRFSERQRPGLASVRVDGERRGGKRDGDSRPVLREAEAEEVRHVRAEKVAPIVATTLQENG
jgi:hypothetical protein